MQGCFLPRSRQASRAKLWSEVLHHLTIHPQPVIASGEQTAWAVRKNNRQLKHCWVGFIAPRAVGSLVRRYLEIIGCWNSLSVIAPCSSVCSLARVIFPQCANLSYWSSGGTADVEHAVSLLSSHSVLSLARGSTWSSPAQAAAAGRR